MIDRATDVSRRRRLSATRSNAYDSLRDARRVYRRALRHYRCWHSNWPIPRGSPRREKLIRISRIYQRSFLAALRDESNPYLADVECLGRFKDSANLVREVRSPGGGRGTSPRRRNVQSSGSLSLFPLVHFRRVEPKFHRARIHHDPVGFTVRSISRAMSHPSPFTVKLPPRTKWRRQEATATMADDGRTCLSFPRAPRYLRLHRGYIVVAFISEQTNGPPPRPFPLPSPPPGRATSFTQAGRNYE